MTRFVKLAIILAWAFAVGLGRNHGRFPGLRQRLEHPFVGIVALIGNDNGRGESRQQHLGPFQITSLSGRQVKAGRVAQGIHRGMDLRAQPALATSDGLVLARFF